MFKTIFPEVLARLQVQGFVSGPPPQVTAATVAIDQRIVKRMRCPACERRHMTGHPYHAGRRYKLLAVCSLCNAAEEV